MKKENLIKFIEENEDIITEEILTAYAEMEGWESSMHMDILLHEDEGEISIEKTSPLSQGWSAMEGEVVASVNGWTEEHLLSDLGWTEEDAEHLQDDVFLPDAKEQINNYLSILSI